MNFEAVLKQGEWTLDDSIPLRIYSDYGKDEPEYILEIPLNEKELKDLQSEVKMALKALQKAKAWRLRCQRRK